MNHEEVVLRGIFNTVIMMGHMGMLWWVSGMAFCLSVIKIMVTHDKEKYPMAHYECVVIFITILFGSIIVFGLIMMIHGSKLQNDAISIISKSGKEFYPVETIFSVVILGFGLGTSSFILIFAIWLYILIDKVQKNDNTN